MVDIEALKEKYLPKLEDESLDWEDVKECIDLLVGVANEDEDFEEEFGSLTKTYQFNVTDKPESEWMWLRITDGKFEAGLGKLDKVDLTFSQTAEVAAGMVSGAINSNTAYMKGDLKIDGQITDGVKFQEILGLFKDVLDI